MGADQGGNLRPGLFHRLSKLGNRAAAFTGFRLSDQLRFGRSTGNPRRANSDSRSFQCVGECGNRSRLARPHTIEQQFRLAIEQLKDFPLEAAVAESHSREMITVEHRHLQCFGLCALVYIDRGLRHLGLPNVFIGEEFGSIGIKSR